MDWVIVGSPAPDGGVRITASIEATGGSVAPVSEKGAALFGGRPVNSYTPRGYRIEVNAERVVVVDAPTYPEALRLLTSVWQPPAPEPVRHAIEGG